MKRKNRGLDVRSNQERFRNSGWSGAREQEEKWDWFALARQFLSCTSVAVTMMAIRSAVGLGVTPALRQRALHTSARWLEEAALNRAERLKSRFWKTVSLQAPSSRDSGYQILLDGRPIRTPSGSAIVIPANRELLATCIAQEWCEQGKLLKPHTLPLTSLAARALEGCSNGQESSQIQTDLLRYLENETVCFQESRPKSLVELQSLHWDPLLSYINSTYNTAIKPFQGLLGGQHPHGTLDIFRNHLAALHPFDLAAFERSVLLTKSFLISVALVSGKLSVQQAAQAAEVEVQSQINRWGSVEDSHDVDHAQMRTTLGSVAIATVRN